MSPGTAILWASPLPPVRSGVSDYAAELLAALRTRARVRVVLPPNEDGVAAWVRGQGYETVGVDEPIAPGERLLVHLGNNPYHRWLLQLVRRRAVVVFHDLVLHHLLVETTVAEGDLLAYRDAVAKSHPRAARGLAAARVVGVSGRLDPFLYPAPTWAVEGARSAVVHSDWARDALHRWCPDLPVARVDLPALDPGPVDRAALRGELGLDPADTIVMHLGFLTRDKGLEILLQAVAAAHRCGAPVRLVTVGEGVGGAEVRRGAEALGIGDRVVATGWVDGDSFPRLPAAADLGVVLRTRSAGETSAAVVRFLAGGTPVAVMGRHQFLEWPEAAAFRVTPGPSAVADLTRVLLERSAEVAEGAGGGRREAARAAYEDGHRPEQVADQLIDVIRRF